VSFLPLVEREGPPDALCRAGDPEPQAQRGVSDRTVPPDAWGGFLCAVFDEWIAQDIGRVKVQIFEEAARPAFEQEHTLCIFRRTCGGVPVIEHNGDFFSCDHFVDDEHRLGNIQSTPLAELLDSPRQRAFGQAKWDTLPRCCRACEVRAMCNGGCPKDRFLRTPEGETGLNYLCAGYKRFFTHCRPFVAEVAAAWRRQQMPQAQTADGRIISKAGRNDPCPCGSGRKYKNCCMGR
jgi:uncharacterized protein